MQKKDFIVRQLEEFGKVMGIILGFKKQKEWDKFDQELSEAALKFTGIELNTIEKMDDAAFESQVLNREGLSLDQKKILADLLFEKMNRALDQEDQAGYLRLKNRCLIFYTHIRENFTENEFDLNVHYKLEFLKNM